MDTDDILLKERKRRSLSLSDQHPECCVRQGGREVRQNPQQHQHGFYDWHGFKSIPGCIFTTPQFARASDSTVERDLPPECKVLAINSDHGGQPRGRMVTPWNFFLPSHSPQREMSRHLERSRGLPPGPFELVVLRNGPPGRFLAFRIQNHSCGKMVMTPTAEIGMEPKRNPVTFHFLQVVTAQKMTSRILVSQPEGPKSPTSQQTGSLLRSPAWGWSVS